MTYGRDLRAGNEQTLDGATVSHTAEPVRGKFIGNEEGPLIRPFSP